MMSIKQLKGQIELKKINGEYPLRLHAALSVLEQFKEVNFDEITFNAINRLKDTIQKQKPVQV
jgi:hypothetical protein